MEFYNPSPEELERSLGEQLKAERLRKNLSMSALADLAGVAESTVRTLESGQGRVESLVRIARALGRTEWLQGFRPPVRISPLQIAKGKPRRQRASPSTSKKKA